MQSKIINQGHKMSTDDFRLWFLEEWEKHGGLIKQQEAALFARVSDAAINKQVKAGKIKCIYWRSIKYLSLDDVKTYAMKREA